MSTISSLFSLPTFFLDEKSSVWLRFDNISKVPSSEWKFEMKKGALEKEPILVIQRTSLGYRQLEFEDTDIFFGETFFFRAYILGYVLKIGDIGPWNCLVQDKSAYLIDFEDVSTRKETEVPFIFFSKFRSESQKEVFNLEFRKKKKEILEFAKSLECHLPEFDLLLRSMNIVPSEEYKTMMSLLI